MSESHESQQFLEVSECLTGFGRAELLATGMAGAYEAELRKTYGGDVVAQLLEEVRAVIREAGGDAAKLEALMLARVFDDDTVLCAPAKNLAQMWFMPGAVPSSAARATERGAADA